MLSLCFRDGLIRLGNILFQCNGVPKFTLSFPLELLKAREVCLGRGQMPFRASERDGGILTSFRNRFGASQRFQVGHGSIELKRDYGQGSREHPAVARAAFRPQILKITVMGGNNLMKCHDRTIEG